LRVHAPNFPSRTVQELHPSNQTSQFYKANFDYSSIGDAFSITGASLTEAVSLNFSQNSGPYLKQAYSVQLVNSPCLSTSQLLHPSFQTSKLMSASFLEYFYLQKVSFKN